MLVIGDVLTSQEQQINDLLGTMTLYFLGTNPTNPTNPIPLHTLNAKFTINRNLFTHSNVLWISKIWTCDHGNEVRGWCAIKKKKKH